MYSHNSLSLKTDESAFAFRGLSYLFLIGLSNNSNGANNRTRIVNGLQKTKALQRTKENLNIFQQ